MKTGPSLGSTDIVIPETIFDFNEDLVSSATEC